MASCVCYCEERGCLECCYCNRKFDGNSELLRRSHELEARILKLRAALESYTNIIGTDNRIAKAALAADQETK